MPICTILLQTKIRLYFQPGTVHLGRINSKLLDKFDDERMSFGKKIIYQESPDTLQNIFLTP